jgi:magnesium chelatase subunit I
VFREYLMGFDFDGLLDQFEGGLLVETGDLVSPSQLLSQLGDPKLGDLLARLDVTEESPAHAAAALEFALEGLHLTRRLNKTASAAAAYYGIG